MLSQPFSIPFLALVLSCSDMNDATSRPRRFSLAPELVPVAFDVVQTVRNNDCILAQRSLDAAKLGSASVLLRCSRVVDLISEADR